MAPSRISAAVGLWKQQLPTVKPFYAVKCNPDPTLLNALFDHGLGFDCASERELLEIRGLARNTLPSRVVYANPCKSSRDLAAAASMGSPMTVVDSVEEVDKLADAKYSGGALVRIAVDDSGSAMPFSSKFGATAANIGGIAAAAARVGIHLQGISFHVGSGCKGGKAFSKAIDASLAMFPVLWKNSHEARILDIGGGFLPFPADFRDKALHIREILYDIDEPLEVWAEPGRFFATDAFDFFVQVIGKKPDPAGGWRYTVDDSIYGQFTNILFDQAKPVWTRVRKEGERLRPYSKGTLFGRTCDSLDVIAKASMEELDIGDWLWFPKMGAYTRATASEFNGFPRPETFSLEPYEILPCGFGEAGLPKDVRHPNPMTVASLMG